MIEELQAIKKNQTWILTKLSFNKRSIDVKWVFKFKLNLDGSVVKRKMRLVIKGFSQKQGLDYS